MNVLGEKLKQHGLSTIRSYRMMDNLFQRHRRWMRFQ